MLIFKDFIIKTAKLQFLLLLFTLSLGFTSTYANGKILNNLMIAEIALDRGYYQLALDHYMIAAKDSQDPELAELATEIAVDLEDELTARNAAKLWAKVDTNNLKSQLVAITLTVGQEDPDVSKYLLQASKLSPENIDEHILNILQRLSLPSQNYLIKTLDKLATDNSNSFAIKLAAAQAAAYSGNIIKASDLVKQALTVNPNFTAAIKLNAKIIRHNDTNDQQALAYLEQQIKNHPINYELIMFYSNALFDNDNFKKAQVYLKKLTKIPQYQPQSSLLLGEIYMLQNKFKLAQTTLKNSLSDELYANKARIILAHMAEESNDFKQAIAWYQQLTPSEYYIDGQLRAVKLLSLQGDHQLALQSLRNLNASNLLEQKQILLHETELLIALEEYEQSRELLDRAILILPEDLELLYARSIVLSKLKLIQEAEQDLMFILKIYPNHADALNTLGYNLIANPKRHSEALKYLKQAMTIEPDNYIYMDSIGWLLYKMDKLTEAKSMLFKAYKISNDVDIAIHLIEVLWKLNDKNQAQDIIQQALLLEPYNGSLIELSKRLGIKINNIAKNNN